MSMVDLSIFSYTLQFLYSRFEVLVIHVFHLLSSNYSKIFYIIQGYCKGYCFPAFFLNPFSLVFVYIGGYRFFFQLILYPTTNSKYFLLQVVFSLVSYHNSRKIRVTWLLSSLEQRDEECQVLCFLLSSISYNNQNK